MSADSFLYQIPRDLTINPADVLKEGWLSKQSKFLKEWRRRWCVLTPKYFCSFKGKDFARLKPTEIIPVQYCCGIRSADDDINQENAFRLDTHDRIFFLVADSTVDKEAWIGFIGRQMMRPNVAAEYIDT
ncbi:AtPH1 family protein [Cardiosporidium cionae]|uniref:AtPH1 family protein n=1 Tax=Cardiosporidium cionae TaxID=476202 RepID=A0ABQ7JBW4_9APIC|nr:AtPH1 family protein [Cardiosporidium cionae]|eukprot:KAF8821461.1 AtPH1 family protein [Cardiosporidium cionae]